VAEMIIFQSRTWWHAKHNIEISNLFRNNFISHVTTV